MTNAPAPTTEQLTIPEALQRAYACWNAGLANQADQLCQRILAVTPGHPSALHLLGIMAHAYGKHELAISHLRKACLAPGAPAIFFSNLAEMCRQKGYLAEAVQAARRAVALDKDLVAAWNNLGIILQQLGQSEESLSCLQRVVELQPEWPEVHNNLGNTLKRLGRLNEAAVYYEQALALNPMYAEAYSNLSLLTKERGELKRARELAQRAIELSPTLADAYINLAGVEMAYNRHEEALRWLDSLICFAPAHPGGLSSRALALKRLDRLDEALDSAQKAVATAPEDPEVLNNLGVILQQLGRLEEALSAFDKAAEMPGLAAAEALANKAMLWVENGNKPEAYAAFDVALQRFPNSAVALSTRADMKKFTADDPDIDHMEALLQSGQVVVQMEVLALHFALGKAYLDIGENQKAFAHFAQANKAKRATIQFDVELTKNWMQRIANAFTPDFMQRFSKVNNSSDAPIFVLGMPRSGTTLVEQILSSHPAVYGAGELGHWQRVVTVLGEYPDHVERISAQQLEQMGNAYLERILPLAKAGERHVVDKMPANFLYAGLIHLALPNARIVHCRRDPADTCLSCYTKLFAGDQPFTYDLAELGHFHRSYQSLMSHWRELLPAERFIEVDYEAVVDNLEGEAKRLIAFLGLPWDEACLSFHENRRAVRTASVNQVRQPIYKSAKGRSQQYAEYLGPLLAALGV